MHDTLAQTATDRVIDLKRECIARFMDEHPDTFARPTNGASWLETIRSRPTFNDTDRRVLDKALGMLAALFRTAQAAVGDSEPLEMILTPERVPGVEMLEPDVEAVNVVGGGDDASAVAFGRAITIYKTFVEAGEIPEDMLRLALDATLESLPGHSPLMRSMIETCRRMTQIDLDHMFVKH